MNDNIGKLHVTFSGDRENVVAREIAAPRRLVYDAGTRPTMVKRWLGGGS